MADSNDTADIVGKELRPLPAIIFGSRWLQLPLYLGLMSLRASMSSCSSRNFGI